jgi:hypothetical protein
LEKTPTRATPPTCTEQAGKKIVHCAAFARSMEDGARARTVIQYTQGWKGVQIYAGGRVMPNSWTVNEVLDCYLAAASCKDWRAHCYTIIDDPRIDVPDNSGCSIRIDLSDKPPLRKATHIEQYIFPCNHIYYKFKFQAGHPAVVQDQIQAAAVNACCDWCPYFDQARFTKTGQRVIYSDAFS